MSRFIDRIDEMADRLQDAAETFRTRRAEILRALDEAKDAFVEVILVAEDWAVKERLLDGDRLVARDGEPLLDYGQTEVIAGEIPDLGSQFRDRVASFQEVEDKT